MNNKKGFTLIELLAIIVILAVIMAIAIPQVLNVVNGSKSSAWKDNVKMISKAIELNTQLFDPETGNYAYTIDSLCKNPSKVNEISKSSDTSVTCSNGVFIVAGKGQFDGFHAEINCSSGNCNSNTYAKGAYCDESIGHIWNFDYTGSEQIFFPPCNGKFKLEAWGAQGGNAKTFIGGYGSYSVGTVTLSQGENVYINVGGSGTTAITEEDGTGKIAYGGYNGGGSAYGALCTNARYAGSGGGATSFNVISGLIDTLKKEKDSIIMIAGGGGGAFYSTGAYGNGAHAGGITGNISTWTNGYHKYYVQPTGGSQTEGGSIGYSYSEKYNRGIPGTFGQGGNYNGATCAEGSGGGAGYYGGGSGQFAPGAGGSSYIGSSRLTDKQMFCMDCEETASQNVYTISTTGSSPLKDMINCSSGYNDNPISKCAKAGNGYARITYIGKN